MENLTVLVTSIDTPTALGVLKGLKEIKHIKIIGINSRTLTAGNVFCDRVYRVPRFTENKDDYFKQLKEIIDKEHVQAVFPSHPQEINLYEDYKQHLKIPFALPNSSHFNRLTHKDTTYHWLNEHGFSKYIPTYYTFNSHDELADLIHNEFKDEEELVIKNTSGYVESDFTLLTHRDKFIEAIETQQSHVFAFEDYLATHNTDHRMVMKKLDQPEFSVDLYIYDTKTVVSVPRQRIGVANGIVLDGTLIEHTKLIAISIDIAEAIIDEGFINLQFMKEDGNFRLTDVNTHFCDSQVMSLGAGVNFPELFLTYNLTDERPIPRPKWNTRMVRYSESVFFHSYNADDEPAVWTAPDE
ncbi:ATP-grasp domain-containing protein [Alkalibacterium sp. f15]|uniref:ATP-grasp domain-containing protein n=1 Tax=Alkalibacterium sp. f15 TaxID=3414029 RepID=UPI003BF81270